MSRARAAPARTSPAVRSVLLVDDHPVFRMGMVALFNAQEDFRVCAEADAVDQAFGLVHSLDPDIVVLDIGLRGASGLDLLARISEASLPDQRVLVVSLRDEAVWAPRALRAGAAGYVMKHEPPERIVEAARRVLAGEMAVSSSVVNLLALDAVGRSSPGTDPARCLSTRELEVFQMIGQGASTRQIAEQLALGYKTIESYRTAIRHKLGLATASDLVRVATLWLASDGTGAV